MYLLQSEPGSLPNDKLKPVPWSVLALMFCNDTGSRWGWEHHQQCQDAGSLTIFMMEAAHSLIFTAIILKISPPKPPPGCLWNIWLSNPSNWFNHTVFKQVIRFFLLLLANQVWEIFHHIQIYNQLKRKMGPYQLMVNRKTTGEWRFSFLNLISTYNHTVIIDQHKKPVTSWYRLKCIIELTPGYTSTPKMIGSCLLQLNMKDLWIHSMDTLDRSTTGDLSNSVTDFVWIHDISGNH